MNRIVFAIVVAIGLAGCNPDDRRSIVRSIVRVPVTIPTAMMVCEEPLPTAGITTERQLARRTVRNEARHWRCVRSIRAVVRFNRDVANRAQQQLRAMGEVY